MEAVLNHLWQSTLFAAAVAVLGLALRNARARTRYWLWLAASLKFLLPFSLLVSLGYRSEKPTMTPVLMPETIERISVTFAPAPLELVSSETGSNRTVWLILWSLGAIAVAAHWAFRWRRLAAIRRAARPLSLDVPIRVFMTSAPVEPGVLGIWRPVLLLPDGLFQALKPEQFEAILSHELCHVRYRDNLTAGLHMVVSTLFWFHPIVWWIGARLVEEREKACDEGVIAEGKAREEYAQSILNVCKLYVASPLPCSSGVSGADLRKRITAIMTHPLPAGLTRTHRALIGAAAATAFAAPFVIGALQGQTSTDGYKFEVASIRPAAPGYSGDSTNTDLGGFRARNITLSHLIEMAYALRPFQLSGGPGWIRQERFDIAAKYDAPERGSLQDRKKRVQARLRRLLAERFQLKLRQETKERPIYALTVERSGHKLKASATGNGSMDTSRRKGSGTLRGEGISMEQLAEALSGVLDRRVVDKTGLDQLYEFDLKWSDGVADSSDPTLFTAIREQIGLRLESAKGPVIHYSVESVEKPSEN